MERTITIKGVGRATIKPDFVILSLKVDAKEKKYADTVAAAQKKIQRLNEALEAAGFEPDCAKTTSYDVHENYSYFRNRKDQVERKSEGYECIHRLKVEFDYDMQLLSKAITIISTSFADPRLNISFTVKDKEAVGEKILSNAAKNAKRKAESMCDAVGATLGKLITIDYNWKEINFHSKFDFMKRNTAPMTPVDGTLIMSAPMHTEAIDIQPDNIDVSDTATFIWEIE